MSFAVDVRRAFSRKPKHINSLKSTALYEWTGADDSKVRYILGLEAAQIEPTRNGSTSTTSTSKLHSVTFSDATTARVSTPDTIEKVRSKALPSSLSHKDSSATLREDDQSAIHERLSDSDLRSQISTDSLRSFYDKSRTPLGVSQQTSDSSSRDFALRRGAPSILTKVNQGMEHSKQLRFFSRSGKKSKRDKEGSTHMPVESTSDIAALPEAQRLSDTNVERVGSLSSQSSVSHISIIKGSTSANSEIIVLTKHRSNTSRRCSMVKNVTDPATAKINVRRPKAGTRNWFDDVESESDEEDNTEIQPRFNGDFASQVEAAFDGGQIDMSLPQTPVWDGKELPAKVFAQQIEQPHVTQRDRSPEVPVPNVDTTPKARKRKGNPFKKADLEEQSVLYLSSSDEEEEQPTSATSYAELARREIRASLMDGFEVDASQALTMGATSSDKSLQKASPAAQVTPSTTEHVTGGTMTYLDNPSSDTLARHEDLLTSFPQTPTDSLSRHTSIRESVLSESDSLTSTKLMPVTRQEQNLIAAMRLKKIAMKRAQTQAHRQNALKTLERESSYMTAPERQIANGGPPPFNPRSPLRPSYFSATGPTFSKNQLQSHDSVTTFQSDSLPGQSTRSSMATYMTGASEDSQPSYLPLEGLPLGVSITSQTLSQRPTGSRNNTFLSDKTGSSISSQPTSVAGKLPIERQVPRSDIPSQFFMEKPYLGWQGLDSRGSLQVAH